MKIVITDAQTITKGDISLDFLKKYGEVVIYPLTSKEEISERLKDADAVICNKTPLNRETLAGAEKLRYIGLFATGYNNIDIDYCNEKGITVCNAGSYSTNAVAQHTFALILEHFTQVGKYNDFVQQGGWKNSPTFSPFVFDINELWGKTIGIVGYGSIGKAVGRIAHAFGMNVLAHSRNFKEVENGKFCSLDQLLQNSDIVTVHCPLNKDSEKMFTKETFNKMKKGAFFVNTSRGGVLCEEDLKGALESGQLSGAGIDVLETEPMKHDCCLLGVKNCVITPHIAWAHYETRIRLMEIVEHNLKSFINGTPTNKVN